MKTFILTAIVLAVPIALLAQHAEHASGLTARVTMRDGATRTATLEGVGCPLSICSRIGIKAKTDHQAVVSWFDSLAAITDTTEHDALFVAKDGSAKRLSLIKDFRVLYLTNASGGADKVDLATVKSVEFLPPAK